MATSLINGQRTWKLKRDSEGYREYTIRFLVECDDPLDGPFKALNTPGLPLPGTPWLIDNDVDYWAWCRPDAEVNPVVEDEPNRFFTIDMVFSNKPPDRNNQRCQEQSIEDPLLEPQKVSGSFVKYTEEATRDRFGFPIVNSAWEQMRGAQVEFDQNRPNVKIVQNVATLGLALFASMVDTVNASPLWGLPARTIKLSNISWERKYYGQCYVYYERTLEFDIRYETFDRYLLDEGTKVLNGYWDGDTGEWVLAPVGTEPPDPDIPNPNRFNPTHFIRFKDRNGENAKVILNGRGEPYDPGTGALTAVEPATGCGDALPTLTLGTNYGPLAIQAPIAHFFGVIAGGVSRRVIITADADMLAAGAITVTLYSRQLVGGVGACTPLTGVTTQVVGNKMYVDGVATTEYMAIGVEGIADVELEYNIEVFGMDDADAPGQIFVQKYGSSNFLLLGIPLSF